MKKDVLICTLYPTLEPRDGFSPWLEYRETEGVFFVDNLKYNRESVEDYFIKAYTRTKMLMIRTPDFIIKRDFIKGYIYELFRIDKCSENYVEIINRKNKLKATVYSAKSNNDDILVKLGYDKESRRRLLAELILQNEIFVPEYEYFDTYNSYINDGLPTYDDLIDAFSDSISEIAKKAKHRGLYSNISKISLIIYSALVMPYLTGGRIYADREEFV